MLNSEGEGDTHIFDIRARVNSYNISMLDAKIMSNNTVHPCASIVQSIVSEDNQNGILALLSLHENGISTEEL